MSAFSSDGEVFGSKMLYASMIVVSVFVIFAALADMAPRYAASPDDGTQIEQVVVTATPSSVG